MCIGVIGCGYWGKNHIKTLSDLGILSAVYDIDDTKANHLASIYKVQAVTLEKMLSDPKINGIIIASSANTHYRLTSQCISAGKNILVEKPIALSYREAVLLYEMASKKGLVFMVGHLLNFHPAYKKIQELISLNEIGKILSIKARRLSMGQIRKEENVLWSFAPHDISLILGLTKNSPRIVSAYGKKIISSIEDEYNIQFDIDDDIKAEIQVSWFHPYKEHKLFILGTNGSIVFDDGLPWENKLTLNKHEICPVLKKCGTITVPLEEKYPLTEELLYFYNCIVNCVTPTTSPAQEGVKVIQLIEEIENFCRKSEAIYIN